MQVPQAAGHGDSDVYRIKYGIAYIYDFNKFKSERLTNFNTADTLSRTKKLFETLGFTVITKENLNHDVSAEQYIYHFHTFHTSYFSLP